MILCLDTSALVKRYFREEYTNEVVSYWENAEEIVTSPVAYAETMACFYRKKREAELSHKFIREITDLFHMDWKSFIRVAVNDELNRYVERVGGNSLCVVSMLFILPQPCLLRRNCRKILFLSVLITDLPELLMKKALWYFLLNCNRGVWQEI